MTNRRIIVKVPASTANLGPGFDTLGMALSLYAWIEMSASLNGDTVIQLHGEGLNGISTDKSNLIYKVAQLVFKEAGVTLPELHISMYSDIPLTRGLGSSASAIVGALVAANALAGSPLSEDRLFQLATELEGHPDNVGASLFGGIVVSAWDGTHAAKVRIEPHAKLDVLVAIPAFQLSTEKARHALPSQISMKDAVFNLGSSSLLVAALASGQLEMIPFAMRDRLHHHHLDRASASGPCRSSRSAIRVMPCGERPLARTTCAPASSARRTASYDRGRDLLVGRAGALDPLQQRAVDVERDQPRPPAVGSVTRPA